MGFWQAIREDYRAAFRMDPAARNPFEVLLTYSGLHAVVLYRIAHGLKKGRVPFLPRALSQFARFLTGVEIHPGAEIGPGLFIDHGMGVVVGETTEIGSNCLLYQGVTLGGTGKESGKRHPTLGNNVVVGAGAKVLGAIRIGHHAKVGANAVVLKPVPDYGIVVGIPGKVVKRRVWTVQQEGPVEMLDHIHLPDPLEDRFVRLQARVQDLERALERIEGKGGRMKLYNTMTGRKETFIPRTEGTVLMYACGVTVYDHCHIGHARSAVVFDVIRQYLIYRGFDVTYVRNFTDVDDKIINRAREEGIPWNEVAEKYTASYYEDMDRLGVARADIEPRATDYIEEMVEIIRDLVDKGVAYEVDGDVYFAVSRFPEYGKLSGRKLDDMMAGARVDVNEAKRHPMDFALWKASKPGEPSWESPWGPGRPGWHIECSAMSIKHLGRGFDIHGGGADLIFPHHENELAQSEAHTGEPFARYWVHNGFITIDKEKMSKSLGNFFTIKDILRRFDPEVVRFFLLSTQYRNPIEFSEEEMRQAEASVGRCYETLARMSAYPGHGAGRKSDPSAEEALRSLLGRLRDLFREAMDDDVNTARALGYLFELIREINRYMDTRPPAETGTALLEDARRTFRELAGVLRLFERSPEDWWRSLLALRDVGLDEPLILDAIRRRAEARAENRPWPRHNYSDRHCPNSRLPIRY